MKALINTTEIVNNFDNTTGFRIVQAHEIPFVVAPELFWIDCDDINPEEYFYEPSTKSILIKPIDPNHQVPMGIDRLTQPISTGTQAF